MQRAQKWGMLLGAAAIVAAAGYWFSDRLLPAEITDLPDLPELIEIPAGDFDFRRVGQFRIDKQIVDAPLHKIKDLPALKVMKYHVSQAEYNRCIADGVCQKTVSKADVNLPQVGISFYDARAYAKWYSEKTKLDWHLPSALEWQRYAGDRYIDLSLGDLNDINDPAQRWIAEYRQQAALRTEADLDLRPRGANGENNYAIADIASNVWEWTDTCYYNIGLDKDGSTILDKFENCAVRAVEGKHTAYIIEFVRDANVGGVLLAFHLIFWDSG